MDKTRQVRLFNKQAVQYKTRKEGAALRSWRQKLLRHATGEVLELAVGAGANFPYYPDGIKLTATDFSPDMLKHAREAAAGYSLDATFILADIEELDFPDHSFDTIVSSLSFCSYEHPLHVMQKLKRWCKPDGHILLMEHGISSNRVVSIGQRVLNPLLLRTIGCHHTRNIPDIVRQSGMFIERSESHMLNMVHLLWVKPET